MSALLLTLALLAQPTAEPSSQPSGATAVPVGTPGTAADVQGEMTVIYELAERVLRAQESWTLHNSSGRTVPAGTIVIPSEPSARRLRMEDNTGAQAADDGSKITITSAFGIGERSISATYEQPLSGDSLVIRRRLPFGLARSRVVIEAFPGVSLTTNVEAVRRKRDLNGVHYLIWELSSLSPGQELELRLSGLPARPTWPRALTLFVAALVLLWALRGIFGGKVPGAGTTSGTIGPLTGLARRDRLVKAVELLERDYKAEKLDAKQYSRRKEALIEDLAAVLREIDLERAAGKPSR